MLTSDCLLAHYGPTKDLTLACDASPYGCRGNTVSHSVAMGMGIDLHTIIHYGVSSSIEDYFQAVLG